MASNSPALPTFEQAGRFATMIGIRTPEEWDRYTAGKSRQDLFEQVISVANKIIILASLED